jgi:hypothetical protein
LEARETRSSDEPLAEAQSQSRGRVLRASGGGGRGSGRGWRTSGGQLQAWVHLAQLREDGTLPIPHGMNVVLEVGANTRNTLDRELLPLDPSTFVLTVSWRRPLGWPRRPAQGPAWPSLCTLCTTPCVRRPTTAPRPPCVRATIPHAPPLDLAQFEPLLDKFASLLSRNSRPDTRAELGFHNPRGIVLPFAISSTPNSMAEFKISGRTDGCASLLDPVASYYSTDCTNTSGILERRYGRHSRSLTPMHVATPSHRYPCALDEAVSWLHAARYHL